MRISIHQPSYFPWLGLLAKVNVSDCLVVLDDVQLSDSAYQHRNIFLNNVGDKIYLTINIEKKGYLQKTIRDIRVLSNHWQKKHYKSIFYFYKKHPYFDLVFPSIEFIFSKHYQFLIDILLDSMVTTFELFSLYPKITMQSSLGLYRPDDKNVMLIELIKKIGGETYISGTGAKSYLKEEYFDNAGIALNYQEFHPQHYSQKNSQNFIPGLSSLDALFNLGPGEASRLL